MPRIIILGAGLTGLSTAYHLEQKGFFDYLLIEKEATPGGLCRTVQQDGFTFDHAGHLLHINDDYMRQLIDKLVSFEALQAIERKSFIYSHGCYTKYPFQINLYGLPIAVIAQCIEGYVKRKKSIKINNFIDWVHKYFGSGFAKHFFIPYQQKIFAYDLKHITASWTGRFVPSTSLEMILEGSFKENNDSIGYNAQFYYPKQGGIQLLIESLIKNITNPVMYNTAATRINLENKRVLLSNGEKLPYDTLINTIPLNVFLNCLEDKSSTHFHDAHDKLHCNQVINFNVGVATTTLPAMHWIYFPEKEFPFYRLGIPSELTPTMAPQGHSSISGEFSLLNKSGSWIDKTITQSIEKIKSLFSLTDQDIVTQKTLHLQHAYVIYDHWREENIEKLHNALHQEKIYSIGRYGEWKYASMQEAILDGKKIVEMLLTKPAQKIIEKTKIVPKPKQKEHSHVS